MFHNNVENAFINSAYLSEKWAVTQLMSFKKANPSLWDNDLEEQLNDEKRHANALHGFLSQRTERIQHDELSWSMQVRLYEFCSGIDFTAYKKKDQFIAMQLIMEKRAVWIYKVYNRFGNNEDLKKLFKVILKDELRHLKPCQPFCEVTYNQIDNIDKWLFKTWIPKNFGDDVAVFNHLFWDYFFQPHVKGAPQARYRPETLKDLR